ncbi:MAG: DUF3800 domain-containing protein [Gammaproteobacteria bacterium]|nr:DUF3800 domain-containing protein [Gammaproteobacteria bacterium]
MALAEMYLDESEVDEHTILCVAGYLFTKDGCEALQREWEPALVESGIPYFHMGDCAHGNEHFKDMETPKRSKIQRRFFEILKRHLWAGFSVTFEMKHQHLLPSSLNLGIEKVTPYALCCYWCLHFARNYLREKSFDGEVAYFFEAGHSHQHQAATIMDSIYKAPAMRQHFRLASYSFVDKRHSGAIQCADILAWQWGKNTKERNHGNDRPRRDLMSLLEKPHFTIHFNEKLILEFVELLRRQRQELDAKKIHE